MTTLSYEIPTAKTEEYVADYCYVHKNTETMEDPTWEDPEDGSVAPQIAKYTNNEWVKEHILRYIRSQIVRGHNAKAKDDLESANADDITQN